MLQASDRQTFSWMISRYFSRCVSRRDVSSSSTCIDAVSVERAGFSLSDVAALPERPCLQSDLPMASSNCSLRRACPG